MIFENTGFANGFIEFVDSNEYQKYMKPFLHEQIELCRTKLETTGDFVVWQSRLAALRQIDNMADTLKREKNTTGKGD